MLLTLLCSLNSMNVEALYGISKSKNVVHLRQILPGSVWPFSSSKEVDIEKTIEYMKLTEEKEDRVAQNLQFNQSMALKHLELNKSMAEFNQSMAEFNQSMALKHLELNKSMAEFNQSMALKHLELNQSKVRQQCQLLLSVFAVLLIVFGCSQCAIYIRDGLLGKKSSEIAFYTSISITVHQLMQSVKAIWDLGILKWFYKFLKQIYTQITRS
jgi:hypothetical protein